MSLVAGNPSPATVRNRLVLPSSRIGVRVALGRIVLGLIVLALGGCAAAESEDDPWKSDGEVSREQAIGWLDGEPVTYGDLARFLRARDALTFSRTLDGLVVDRITRAEADTKRVDVPLSLVERRTSTRYVAFEQRLRAATKEQTGAEIDPRLWLRRTLGLTPAQFRIYLRSQIEVELLQDRLIRYAQFRERSVDASIIVVETPAAAGAVLERLERGDPFPVVAKELSKHATAAAGGRIDHRLIAADFEDAAAARAVLSAAQGGVVGPFEAQADGRAFFRIYRVDGTREAKNAPYSEQASGIEADLEKRPVSVREYVHWRRRMQETHGFLPSADGSVPR